MQSDYDVRRHRWEQRAEWPLMAAALLFLAAYAAPIIEPDLPSNTIRAASWIVTATWAVFALDYLVRLLLSEQRRAFVRHNVFDLIVVAVPILRPLRLLRLVTLLSVLNRHAGSRLRGRVATYAVGGTVLLVTVGALAALDAERRSTEANITTFGDAVWWAMATVSTAGYGDRFPVTTTGRAVGGALMLGGVALLGAVTAMLASWLVERVREVEEVGQAASRRDVEALAAEVAALRAELKQSPHG